MSDKHGHTNLKTCCYNFLIKKKEERIQILTDINSGKTDFISAIKNIVHAPSQLIKSWTF